MTWSAERKAAARKRIADNGKASILGNEAWKALSNREPKGKPAKVRLRLTPEECFGNAWGGASGESRGKAVMAANWIKSRSALGISQAELARRIGIPRLRLHLAEHGDIVMKNEERRRIAAALKCEVERLRSAFDQIEADLLEIEGGPPIEMLEESPISGQHGPARILYKNGRATDAAL